MPMLFISYKRGDSTVEPIVQELRRANYRTWFDKENILTGTDWRKSIERGIDQSAAVIAIINQDAAESPYVLEELNFARAKNKPIFPIITHDAAKGNLDKLGLKEIQYIELTQTGYWMERIHQLIKDLIENGIRASRHENSELRTDHLYQLYLTRLRSRIGYLNLSRVLPGQDDVPLERVYIPLPINDSLGIEIQNYKIVNWWINKKEKVGHLESPIKLKPRDLFGQSVDMGALDIRVDQIQDAVIKGVDSIYDDPRKRPLVFAPPWYDGIKPSFWPLSAIDAVAASDRLVLLGPPGSGKTTFARHLALCLLGTHINLTGATVNDLVVWPHGAMIPIYIELRQFVGWKGFPELGKPILEEHFWNYIQEEVLGGDLAGLQPKLRDDLIAGKAIIILDGLDEIPVPLTEGAMDARQRQMKDLARILHTTYPRSRILFTSRPYGYQGWNLDGFQTVLLDSLTLKQMSNLASNLYKAHNLKQEDAQAKAELLIVALENVPGALKDYPLFLTLMATLFLSGKEDGLPTKRGELYYQSIMLLLDRWAEPRMGEKSLLNQIGCSSKQLFERLTAIAFNAQSNSEILAPLETGNIELGSILAELFKLGVGANPYQLLPYLSQQSGVLISPSAEIYQFAHRSFQEYLAAEYFFKKNDCHFVRKTFEGNSILWRESCLLLGDIFVSRNDIDGLWNLIDSLIDNDIEFVESGGPYWKSVWLASRLVLDQQVYVKPAGRRNKSIRFEIIRICKTLLSHDVLSPLERADIGKCLGLLGDDRLGVGSVKGIPDILWSKIPEGNFQMGTTADHIENMKDVEWAHGWAFTREIPSAIQFLPTFHISRYPITNEQFNSFINDPDGYPNKKWWNNRGNEWRDSGGRLTDPSWGNIPNYPRTSVSWYEAVAFCKWLSSKLGYKVRLPTEAEWEKAARGIDGRLFAWGDKFDSQKCNMNQTGIGQPSPVGIFLTPDSYWGSDGPSDMSGNIWEWCSTICEDKQGNIIPYPYKQDDRENEELGENYLRIMRGGSFMNPPLLVRTAFRGRGKPSSQFPMEGFRVVTNGLS